MSFPRHGIPKKVLLGKSPEYISVFNLYRALMAREFLRILNDSYWARARGGADDLGNEWEPLTKETLRIKEQLREDLGSYKLFRQWYKGITGTETFPADAAFRQGVKDKGLLNPEQQSKFEKVYKQALGESKGPTAKRVARDAAWSATTGNTEREFVDLINIRTGRLVAATKPGTVSGGRYYAPPDQEVVITYGSIHIKLNVEYADDVESLKDRFIIPDNILPWVEEAHNAIIQEVKGLYVSLLSRHKSRLRALANRRRIAKDRKDKAGGNRRSAGG